MNLAKRWKHPRFGNHFGEGFFFFISPIRVLVSKMLVMSTTLFSCLRFFLREAKRKFNFSFDAQSFRDWMFTLEHYIFFFVGKWWRRWCETWKQCQIFLYKINNYIFNFRSKLSFYFWVCQKQSENFPGQVWKMMMDRL